MTSHRPFRGFFLSVAFVSALLPGWASAYAQQTSLATVVQRPAAGLADMGAVPAGQATQAVLYLAPSAARTAALDAFLTQVVNTASPSYHRWLTPAQFGTSFGPEPAQMAAVHGFLEGAGLQVTDASASGLRVTVTGTAAQMEAAFAPGLHTFSAGTAAAIGNTAQPSVPSGLAATILDIGGFDAVTAPSTVLTADGGAATTGSLLSGFGNAVTANSARVLTITTTDCAETVAPADAAAFASLAREAAAQGTTVLAGASCAGGSAALPATLAEVTSVVLAPGLGNAIAASVLGSRPGWQVAGGLPQNGLREAPDATVSSLATLAAAVQSILAKLPAQADGTPARIGNLAPTLYSLATRPGLFTQADGAAGGTWEGATGLGLLDPRALDKFYPYGTLSVNVSIISSNYSPTHGTSITLTSSVTDTSGKSNGAVATGTITFTDANGNVLGAPSLVNGTATLTTNTLPGGPITVTASYSGDGTFLATKSTPITFTIQGEAANVSASTSGSVVLGANIPVNITVSSASGVGTPSGTVSATLQGVATTTTETATLAGANGTATAIILVPAAIAGTVNIVVACMPTDPSFTCYQQMNVSATVTPGMSATTLSISPTTPVTGQALTLTAKVTGAASAAVPTGGVNFYDNGQFLGSGTLASGTATYTVAALAGTTHSFTATYVGDGNYMTSTSSGVNNGSTAVTTTTTLQLNPTSPVNGAATTLTSTVSNAGAAAAPTGTVQFFQDGVFIGQGTVGGNGTATFTSTTLSSAAAHTYLAMYLGDTANAASQSPAVPTTATGKTGIATTLNVSVATTTPTQGVATTVSATVVVTGTAAATGPTGTVNLYSSVQGLLGTVTLTNGTATLPVTFTTAGVQQIYGQYVGDSNYASSGGPNFQVNVTAATTGTSTTSTTIGLATATPTVGVAATVSATVAVTGTARTASPTGMVMFYSSVQGLLGSAMLNGPVATLAVTFTTAGTQTIYAIYVGDTNYTGSTSTPVAITVAAAAANNPLQTLTVSPVSPIPYGAPIVVTANLTGITLTSGTIPAGTETFAVTPAGVVTNATVALVATSATTSTETYTFTAPTPGTYTLTASCTGANFTCAATTGTTSIVVVKGFTTTTVTALPTLPVQGQPTVLTATIAAMAPSTNPLLNFTGTVTFYNNGVALGMGTVTGGMATFTTTLNTTAANVITAIYSGDTNWNTSTSPALTLVTPPTVTSGTLSVNLTRALYTANLIFTANISALPTATSPTPATPYGSVTFLDTFNGQTNTLATGALVTTNPYGSVAQFSTIGLLPGTHTITALFASSTTFTGTTTNAVTVNITDYSLSFGPSALGLTRGNSGSVTVTVTAINGFSGTVVLGCTPPSGTATTCKFSPASLSPNGTTTLQITTAAPSAARSAGTGSLASVAASGVSLAAVFGLLLLPRRRRRGYGPALLAIVALAGLLGAAGCTNIRDTGDPIVTTGGNTGTPLGAQLFTITTSGTDGVTTVSHNTQYQVNVQ